MKKTFYTELAYLIGIIVLALSAAMMVKADFGLSMVVAPAYLFHLKISQYFSFFTFGMAEYCFQAVLLIALVIIGRKFKRAYIFSLITAVIYGFTLDGFIALLSLISFDAIALRIVFFVLGLLLCSFSVALLFETYIPPEAYEVFVKETAERTGAKISTVKTLYDCASCALAVLLSFIFFGFGVFKGVGFGTVICALINGTIIGKFSSIFHRFFVFKDRFSFRSFFEN